MSGQSERYTSVAIALHWLIALAIIGLVLGGWYMTDLPDGAPGQYALYQLHKSVGITVLLLTVARIIWRVMNPPPSHPSEMAGWETMLSHIVHMAFYALMILLPLTGWLYSSVSMKLDVPTVLYGLISWPDMPFVETLKTESASSVANSAHGLLGWVMIALVGLHVAGAVKHEISAEDGVLKRMIPRLFGKTAKPKLPGRGAITAFGSALATLIVIAGAAPVMSALSGNGNPVSADAGFDQNWIVSKDNSSISFSGIHDGNTFTGSFTNWDAAIQFDPEAPDQAEVRVTVSTTGVEASQRLYTDSLPSPEWFNTSAFPTASVEILNINRTGEEAYTSTARLTLKEATVDADFSFELVINGDAARMTGRAIFQRKPLDLGQSSDPNADWVSEDVTVDVIVEAQRSE